MGDINPSKMPKARTITRKDDPNKVKVFKAGGKSRVNEAGNYTKPSMRKAIFERIKAGGKGGAPGQWSARKAQMLAQQYKKSGGGPCIKIEGFLKKKPQKSLKNWTDQKWRTKSGKPSTQGPKATGERYLPESAIKSLSPAEYAATSRAKRAGKAKGKQFVKQPKSIARKTARHR
jgi:ABC-type transport system substrate-binding protein